MSINIAIDGPAGAGKSSTAKKIATILNFIYLDTGALYRTVGLYAYNSNLVKNYKDSNEISPLLEHINIELKYEDGVQVIYLNGVNVNSDIRMPNISSIASDVSSIPAVRNFLLDIQRSIAFKENVIMDGRDIGTVILPDADVKIFLTASPEARAHRRTDELKTKGIDADYNSVLKEIIQRDYNDSTRSIAPLKMADDAILVDNSDMSESETIDYILDIIRKKVELD